MTPATAARIASRFIPEGATAHTREGVDAVAYTFSRAGRLSILAFVGSSAKPSFCFYYPSEERRQASLTNFFDIQQEHAQRAAEHRAAQKAVRSAFQTSLKAGDILHYSWGYEQTNCEFYQVLEVRGKTTLTLRRIEAEISGGNGNSMSGNATPLPGKFMSDPPLTKYAQPNGPASELIRMDHGVATRWNGRPMYCSCYA